MRKNEDKTGAKRKVKGRSYTRSLSVSPNEKRRQMINEKGLDGHTVVSVRMRNAEFLVFADQVEAAGMTNNGALRVAARRIAGFLEVDEESKEALKVIARQITGIANNVNQMAKIANTTNSVDHSEFLKERKILGKELSRLSDLQQQLLNIGRRREDGMQRLLQAVDDA